jgi:hypothetical protein
MPTIANYPHEILFHLQFANDFTRFGRSLPCVAALALEVRGK